MGSWVCGAQEDVQGAHGQVPVSQHLVMKGWRQVWKEERAECEALRVPSPLWGAGRLGHGELGSGGSCAPWGSGLAHFLSLSLQSGGFHPGLPSWVM